MKKFFLALIPSLFLLLALTAASCELTGNGPLAEDAPPSEVLKAFIEAKKKRDVEGVKKTISADSLKMYEDMARQQNTPVEALLTDNTGSVLSDLPPIRNERIRGDTATVEAQVPQTGVWQEIPFVREETGWKIAMDKVMIEAMKKVQETLQEALERPAGREPRANPDETDPPTGTDANR